MYCKRSGALLGRDPRLALFSLLVSRFYFNGCVELSLLLVEMCISRKYPYSPIEGIGNAGGEGVRGRTKLQYLYDRKLQVLRFRRSF